MKVDISDIIRVNGASMEIDFEEAPSEMEPMEGCLLDGKLSFTGTFTNTNGIMQLNGRLNAVYSSECYRCLCAVKKNMNLRINENFINSAEAEQTDMYPFEGKRIDIGKALNDNIILNLPMKQLCSDDCKGLCGSCGANLNEEQCSCGGNDLDPRMEGLGKFLEKL